MSNFDRNSDFGISGSEFEIQRTPAELFRWADQRLDEIVATFGRDAIKFGTHPLMRKLRDEAWPLAHYATAMHPNDDGARFLVIASQARYDALFFGNGGTPHQIQITDALDRFAGEQEHLRALHSRDYGRAPMTTSGPLKRGADGAVLEQESDCVAMNPRLEGLANLTAASIIRKSETSTDCDTLLVVNLKGLLQGDRKELGILVPALRAAIPPKLPFVGVGVVSLQGHLVIWRTGDNPELHLHQGKPA